MGAHRCRSSGVSNPRGGLQRTAPARGIHGVFGLACEAPDPWGQLQRPSQGSWAWRRGRGAPALQEGLRRLGLGVKSTRSPSSPLHPPGALQALPPTPGSASTGRAAPFGVPSPPLPGRQPAHVSRVTARSFTPGKPRASEVPMLQFLERFPVVWAELRPQTVGLVQKPSSVAFHQTTGKENERP